MTFFVAEPPVGSESGGVVVGGECDASLEASRFASQDAVCRESLAPARDSFAKIRHWLDAKFIGAQSDGKQV